MGEGWNISPSDLPQGYDLPLKYIQHFKLVCPHIEGALIFIPELNNDNAFSDIRAFDC
jgi:hypothetical protein